MKDCNEGRHWFWIAIWDAHRWEQISAEATLYGDIEVKARCTVCGKHIEYNIPGGP
jgi:hypothetical protein